MLKAGFSRLDVTPPLGSYVAGYFLARYAKGVLDPIYLNALAMSDGEETAVLITADFLNLDVTCADELRDLIEKRTGIPAGHVMISCLHQHTSVTIRDKDATSVTKDTVYRDYLWRKFADVAQMAMNDLGEATLSMGQRETEKPIAFIRRYYMKDGTVATNPREDQRENIDRPCDQADNTVRLLRFSRKEGKDIALVNFSTHPDVIGGELLSADWPGFVRRFVEEDIENVSCLLLNGVQGDSNHFNPIAGQRRRGYDYSQYMGRMIADAVKLLWNETEPCEVSYVKADVTAVYNRTRTMGEETYEACRKLLADHEAKGKESPYSITELGNAKRIVGLRTATIYRRLSVTAISLGKIALVGFGGEPFTHYATALRAACPDYTIVAACCTNGAAGYLPTAMAFAEGGYEAGASFFSETLESESVTAAAELLKSLAKESRDEE